MKRKIALVLALAMLFTAGCGKKYEVYELTPGDNNTSSQEVEVDPYVPDVSEVELPPIAEGLGTTDFADMYYEHYDPTAVLATIESLSADLEAGTDSETILSGFDDVMDEIEIMSLSYEMAQLYNSIDATDQYYMDELTYITEQYNIVTDKASILGKAILESEHGDAARAQWEPYDVEYFEDYVAMTDEQMALDNEEQELVNQYNAAAVAGFASNIDGVDYDMGDLAPAYYDGTITYEQYVTAYYDCLDKRAAVLGPIYVDMVNVRQRIARAYGYSNYVDYAYAEIYDRDYTAADAQAFCDEVKTYLVPVYNNFSNTADDSLFGDLDTIATSMTADEQLELIKPYMAKVDPQLLSHFNYMQQYHLYDIDSRPEKSDGGFTTFLEVYDQPFFYNQPDDSFYDIMTAVHEFGHFNAMCVNVKESGSVQDLDLAEIDSQGLELLFTQFYGDMFGEAYGQAATTYTLDQRVGSVLEGCLYDEFQREVYMVDSPSLSEINIIYSNVASQYYPDYYEPGTEDTWWMLVPHNFESPLYYISYAVSVVPALEIWEISQDDFEGACDVYMQVVRAGEANGYKETLNEIGLSTPFDAGTIRGIAEMLQRF